MSYNEGDSGRALKFLSISGSAGYCAKKEYARDGLFLFLETLGGDCGVKVSDRTLVCVLSAVSRVGCLETGVGVHGYIVKTMCDVENDVYLGTGLVDMYVKCGCLDSALYVFRSMGSSEIKSEAKNQNKFINQLQMTLIKA
nr:pentatricopeptide repeat-containing protein At3g18970 [Tanacetum cinerariifolium]